jgi:hypothetical protein
MAVCYRYLNEHLILFAGFIMCRIFIPQPTKSQNNFLTNLGFNQSRRR